MRRTAAAACLLLPMLAGPAYALDPVRLYGGTLEMEIRRDGTPVGTHVVAFARDGSGMLVEARSDIAVRIFGITVYRFAYASRSRWDGGQLVWLDAETNDDGRVTRVAVRPADGFLLVSGPAGRREMPAETFPTDHWHAGVVAADAVLNTITGGLDRVTIATGPHDVIDTPGGPLRATRISYRGDLAVTAWYDDAGRWVALRFPGTDGSTIDYVCRACAGTE